jgi:HlyD family secretion protein
MRKWIPRLLVVAAALGLLMRFTVFRPDPIVVKAVPAERAAVQSTITNTKAGTVKARRRSHLSAEVGGRVVEVLHREGDRVERGEVLVRLNDSSPRAQLRLSRESLRVAQATARQACITRDRARRELERKRSLADQKIVSVDLLDELESAANAATASCNAASAEIDRAGAMIAAAETDLEKFVILAPFGGVIAEQPVEVGEWITPSPPLLTSPAVVDLIDPSSMYVSAPMDEVDSGSVRPGQSAIVSVDSHPELEMPGRVARVAPYVLDVEAQNRTVEIEVEIDDAEFAARLLPGTSADVEVILEVRSGVLRIPTAALLENRSVLVPENGNLALREVEIGLKNWDWAEVRSGLQDGELVVISLDRVEVEDGARVEVEETVFQP